MEFRDLKRQYLNNRRSIDDAINEVIEKTQFIGGAPIDELEKKLAEYVGVKHCITCANGTDALSLALMAWDIGEGDAVFVPDFTFFSSGEVVSFEGATPVFVDVKEDTYNIDPDKLHKSIERVIKEKKYTPKVIISVDLFGQPAEYKKIRKIADQYGMYILEDAAQGFGGAIALKKACSFGDISTTSFFPAKPLGCYGDGGAVFTDDDEWAAIIRSLHIHGKGSYKYDNVRIGMNSRLDTIQAAILLAKFDTFVNCEIDAVNRIAKRYTEELKEIVRVPTICDGYTSSWAQYTIQLSCEKERDELQIYLKEKGIPSMVYYPKGMHEQVAFSTTPSVKEDLLITTNLCKRVLALPMHPYMEEWEIEEVIKWIKDFFMKK